MFIFRQKLKNLLIYIIKHMSLDPVVVSVSLRIRLVATAVL
eukprot:COSAG01_NODE_33678_length_560_cov_1.607375_1_plen_40_part_01